MTMVHPLRDCILSNERVLYLCTCFSLIVIYIYLSSTGFVIAASEPFNCNKGASSHDIFREDLSIRPLSDGKLLAHFQFVTTYRKSIKNLRWENKIELLPLTIVDLVTTTGLNELHFSLTKGNWNYKNWGYPARSSPPGAQIVAKFSKHDKNLEETWKRLTNSLAGKFCASLASADERVVTMPKLSFSNGAGLFLSSGAWPLKDYKNDSNNSRDSTEEQVLYANMPDETLCTGNLTPWKKLLPCYSNLGLSSLLNPTNLFKSSFSSLAVDLTPKPCLDKYDDVVPGCERVQLEQSISVVFNSLQQFEGKQIWSLAKTFGNSIKATCPVAETSLIHVDTTDLNDKTKLYPQGIFQEYSIKYGRSRQSSIERQYSYCNLKELLHHEIVNTSNKSSLSGREKALNLGVKQTHLFKRPLVRPSLPVSLRTHIAGIGSYEGTIVATITNLLDEPIRAIYMDILPHFIRVYLHTLHVVETRSNQVLKPDKLNYLLSKDDTTPTMIELSLVLPANSDTQISYDFDRAFLRWTDFRPEANKGVLLSSAMIVVSTRAARVLDQVALPRCLAGQMRKLQQSSEPSKRVDPSDDTSLASNMSASLLVDQWLHVPSASEELIRIYARPLLVILPTPDFSMPYNVLCLVSTVLVFAFGPIYNRAIRRPTIRRQVKKKLDTSDKQADSGSSVKE